MDDVPADPFVPDKLDIAFLMATPEPNHLCPTTALPAIARHLTHITAQALADAPTTSPASLHSAPETFTASPGAVVEPGTGTAGSGRPGTTPCMPHNASARTTAACVNHPYELHTTDRPSTMPAWDSRSEPVNFPDQLVYAGPALDAKSPVARALSATRRSPLGGHALLRSFLIRKCRHTTECRWQGGHLGFQGSPELPCFKEAPLCPAFARRNITAIRMEGARPGT